MLIFFPKHLVVLASALRLEGVIKLVSDVSVRPYSIVSNRARDRYSSSRHFIAHNYFSPDMMVVTIYEDGAGPEVIYYYALTEFYQFISIERFLLHSGSQITGLHLNPDHPASM